MEGLEVYSDKQVLISRDVLGRVVVAGVVDYFNAGPVATVLACEMERWHGEPAAPGGGAYDDGDLLVDLSRLEFSDVTGIRALVGVAERATGGRRLVLRGLPPQISRVMAVVGWAELPNLVVEGI